MDACLKKKNMGLSACNKLPQMPKGMITTPVGFKATALEAVDPDFWQAALLADSGVRIYLWPPFFDFKDNSEKAIYQSTPLGEKAVRDGRYSFEFAISENLCIHKSMFTHRSQSGRVFLLDVANQLSGTTDADGNFMGFRYSMLNTEKLGLSNGTNATVSPVRVTLADNLEWDRNGSLLDASFIEDLNRLTDVTLEIVADSVSANSLQVSVTVTCDGTKVNGLVLADFVLTKTDGTAQTTAPTSCVEDDGVYTISKVGGTAWADGFLDLVDADALSIEAYESTGAVAVDVP